MPMKERVMQIIAIFCGGKQIEFAESIEMSQSGFSSALRRDSFSRGLLEKILSVYTEVNPTWLYTGEGEMFRSGVTPEMPIARPKKSEKQEEEVDIVDLEKKIVRLEAQNELLREQNAQLLEALKAGTNRGIISANEGKVYNGQA